MPLLQQNYPKIRFWRKQDWVGSKDQETTEIHNKMGLRGKTRIAAGENVSFGFVEDINGLTVNGFCVSEITSVTREIWAELHDRNMAPTTWGKSSATTRNFYRMEMYKRVPELQYCENHWKADHLTTMNYSGWYRKHILGGSGNRLPKIEKDLDAQTDNAADHDENDYMHLPQKRLSMDPIPPAKKNKKFNVPMLPKPREKTPDANTKPDSTLPISPIVLSIVKDSIPVVSTSAEPLAALPELVVPQVQAKDLQMTSGPIVHRPQENNGRWPSFSITYLPLT